MRISVGGSKMINTSYKAGGLFNDGTSIAIETPPVVAGEHLISITLGVTDEETEWTYLFEDSLSFEIAKRRVIQFEKGSEFTVE